jgi:Flp pilus assembly protein TadD/4-amino-4-deoxy-L-arabinose transferase-like glycosyltransferase
MQIYNSYKEKSSIRLGVILVTTLAVVTRVYYINDFQYNPFSYNIYYHTDSFQFYIGAKNFAAGDNLALSLSNQFSPLYTYFTGFLFKLFGQSLDVVWFMQFAMGAITVALVYLISMELFNSRAAIFSAILYNFYGPALMYEGTMLRASFLAFFGTMSLYLIIQVFKNPRNLLIVAAGVSISLFIQCRPNVALIFLLLPLLYLYPFDRQKLELFIKMGSVAIILFIPLLYRSWLVHGRFVFFDASGPYALLMGNHPGYLGIALSKIHEYPDALKMSYSEMISILLDRLIHHPMDMLALYVRKMFYLFYSSEVYNNYDFLMFRKFSPILNTPLSNFTLISSMALTGIFFKIGKGENIKLLYAFMLGSVVSVLLIFIVARFRVPIVPFFAIFAGYSLDTFLNYLKLNQWIKTVQMFLCFSFLILLFNIPASGAGNKQHLTERINNQTGLNLVFNKRYSQAIEPLNQFLKSNSADIPALKALALAYREVGDKRRSVMAYEKVTYLEPKNAEVHFNLASLYADRKDWEKAVFHMKLAEHHFQREGDPIGLNIAREQIHQFSLKKITFFEFFDPEELNFRTRQSDDDVLDYQIGLYYLYSGQYSKAIQPLKKHLMKYSEHGRALTMLALSYFQVGDKNKAIQIQEKLISLKPKDGGAYFDMATLYADSKNWGKAVYYMKLAERMFLQTGIFDSANMAREKIEHYSNRI